MTRSTALVFFGLIFASDAYGQQTVGGCPVLPANNIWNTPVDTLPVLSNSDDDGEHDRRQHADSMPTSARARGTADRSAFRSSPCPGRRRNIRRRFCTRDESDPGRTRFR